MARIRKIDVSAGVYWVEIPEADIRLLCGCPADTVKHLRKQGLIAQVESGGVKYESGPNAILLSDLTLQDGRVSNYAEFPVLQMLYLQGLIVPGHPNNTGEAPLLVGSKAQVDAQMDYIFLGNYGLSSREELLEAGATPEMADEVMRMKLAFAFGRIRPSNELLSALYVEGEPATIRDDVTVTRLALNLFRIACGDEHVDVNLTLAPGDTYECPYRLENHLLRPDYFSVIHSGGGDGWDFNRPCMASIVVFQGRIYLIDAGPNIQTSLNALGIGINEIEGVFHTHGHDDHFAGLTQLLRCDRRLKYFAVPIVRASVVRKLEAVMGASETEFRELFDVHDLQLGEWNDIDGLEVKPFLSPHPVENTCFRFRVFWEGGYRSYAHLSDTVSLKVLAGMVAADNVPKGISAARLETTRHDYAETADIKKIDIGGGLIHGDAVDFRGDLSKRLILAHTSRALTDEERTIGSGAPFATVDVLIEGVSDQLRRTAFTYLSDYFPTAPLHAVRHLMNNRIATFNPETLLIKHGQQTDEVLLILRGSAEMLRPGIPGGYQLFSGSMLGEMSTLLSENADAACRAISFLQALRIPGDLYRDFVIRNGLYEGILLSRPKSSFLRGCWLFAEGMSSVTLNRLAQTAEIRRYAAGTELSPPADELLVIHAGSALLEMANGKSESLGTGANIGGRALGSATSHQATIRFVEATEVYALPLELVSCLPVVRWKLIETFRRRYLDI